jgi:hypothetical protein
MPHKLSRSQCIGEVLFCGFVQRSRRQIVSLAVSRRYAGLDPCIQADAFTKQLTELERYDEAHANRRSIALGCADQVRA